MMEQLVPPIEIESRLEIKSTKYEFRHYLKDALKYDYHRRLQEDFDSKKEKVIALLEKNIPINKIRIQLDIKYNISTLRLRIDEMERSNLIQKKSVNDK